jgi:phytoene dehydrogenase-like protein
MMQTMIRPAFHVRSSLRHGRLLSSDVKRAEQYTHNKYIPSLTQLYVRPKNAKYDAIVIGGGHNGLVTSAYLSKAGLRTLVLERRHVVGGAAVTEEMVPGFKFSRASYLAGLFRPHIIKELELEKHGFKYLPRNPSSFTPTKLDSIYEGKSLMLGSDEEMNWKSIAQFSVKDADAFIEYEAFLGKIREILQPLLDHHPIDITTGNVKERFRMLKALNEVVRLGYKNREIAIPFYELFTGPAEQILDRWFESDILKTTLATDAVIGALISPKHNGSAYVLLHHVMGEAAGQKGVWAYVEGGMGAISQSIAKSSAEKGTEIVTNACVKQILMKNDKAVGVLMEDGSEIHADIIIANTNPYHTFLELMPRNSDTRSSSSSSRLQAFQHHLHHAGILNFT